MRHIPVWKPVIILISSLIALLYSAPSLMGNVPAWWPGWLPDKVVHRGLDLQGGLYLLYHVEVDKAVEQSAENLVDEVRRVLRKDHHSYRGVSRTGLATVTLTLSERSDAAAIRKVLEEEFPNATVEDDGPLQVIRVTLAEAHQKETRQFAVEQAIEVIRSRVDQFGVSEPTIQRQGEERILVQLPGLKDPRRAIDAIGRTARLEFHMVDDKGDLDAALQGRVPPGDVVLYGQERRQADGKETRTPYLLKKRAELTGDRLTDARVNIDQQYNEPYVLITFDRQGARKFAQLTGDHEGQRMAIVLDHQVYSAPVIREKIEGGRAQITGGFTPEEAHDLAIVLRSGALPAPISIMEQRTVGPTMGRDSINQGLLSCLIGGGLVMLFMVLYYRGFGLLANVAVLFNVLILLAVLVWLQATLTLPGIAGMVLLIGMSVDANVLIFERIREELRLGKNPLAAIDHGYDKAFVTILDSNITTLITTAVLYQFGTGPVRGFAVTLSIGLVASMFTAIFMTRVMLSMILKNRRPRTLSI
ncbi:MAG: protein translocase subunit SecD [Magnetococcales bacterium]|nr:protein translocase subunit SecD [Magnetococcales bacterium]